MTLLKESDRDILPVATLGHPVLSQIADSVADIDDDVRLMCEDMIRAMYAYDGIGLAAPQVAISKRIVAIDIPGPDASELNGLNASPGELQLLPKMPMVLINPELTLVPEPLEKCDEGCLSLPDLSGPVERPVKCILRSKVIYAKTGEVGDVNVECGGLLSRCLQHEIDHLDGVVYVDRMALPDRVKMKAKLIKLKRVGKKRNYLRFYGG